MTLSPPACPGSLSTVFTAPDGPEGTFRADFFKTPAGGPELGWRAGGFLRSVVARRAWTMEGDWIWRGRVLPASFLSWAGGWTGTGRRTAGTVLRSFSFLGTGGGREEETRAGLAGSLDLLLAALFGGLFVTAFPGDLNS